MSKEEKLLNRLLSRLKDMTFDELETLLKRFDYVLDNKGLTSGSRIIFYREGYEVIAMHKSHDGRSLHEYQIKAVINTLRRNKLI